MTMAIPPARGLFGVVRSVTDWTIGTANLVVVLPARIATLLGAVELLLARITQLVDAAARIVDEAAATVDRVALVVDGAETTVDRVALVVDGAATTVNRASHVVDGAEATVSEADLVALRAGSVVTDAGTASAQAQELLDAYRETALRLAPKADQLVQSISADEVRALIKLIDVLPEFVDAMQTDIMPILGTLDRVAPDLDGLLNVARDVREAVVGIPGFKFLRKRGEHMIDPHHQPDHPA